jgi:ankyrin repeat protein
LLALRCPSTNRSKKYLYFIAHNSEVENLQEVVWECDAQSNYLTFLEKKLRRSNANDDAAADLDQFFALAAASGVIDVQAVSGETPLLLACRSFTAERKRDVVRQLLTHGANPNIVVSTFNVPHLLVLSERIVSLNIAFYENTRYI